MLFRIISLAAAVTLVMLLSASDVQAWGAYHAGYTHVGPGGIYHYGRTAAVGPYGAYSGGHVGVYHAGYGYGDRYGLYGYHPYAPGYAGLYHYGGIGYGGYGGYRAGFYRRW